MFILEKRPALPGITVCKDFALQVLISGSGPAIDDLGPIGIGMLFSQLILLFITPAHCRS